MNLITDTVLNFWKTTRKTKITPTGWISGNAVCCHHRGERQDKRGRAGIILTNDGWNYSCFNCQFKSGWTPGHTLSQNTKKFMIWLGIPDADVQKLSLYALSIREANIPSKFKISLELEEKPLPDNTKPIVDLALENCTDPDFIETVEYLISRGFSVDWYKWMWSSENGYRDRLIIPFFHDGKVVGWTARKINSGSPKYLTVSQPGLLFNVDRQNDQRKFSILVEGVMDAIPIDAMALLKREINDAQLSRINNLGKEIIVVPDNDVPGIALIDLAMEHGWSVSLPDWGDDVKDVADAVKKFGRLYTLVSIIKNREHGNIKLTMIKKRIINAAENKQQL